MTLGTGDALAAALTSVLYRDGRPDEAAELAVAAAGATVEHPDGRPNLTPARHVTSAPRRAAGSCLPAHVDWRLNYRSSTRRTAPPKATRDGAPRATRSPQLSRPLR